MRMVPSEFLLCNEVLVLIEIVAVTPLPDLVLDLHYQNGEQRRFDFKPLTAMKLWNRIATLSMFRHVKPAHGTISWPGEIDIAPETLYADFVPLAE